ncbi:MAG: glucuronate isomerase [Balneolales bacterium]
MKPFIHENFLLQNKTAQKLYHDYARDLPIIDYHCHLSPDDIVNNTQFGNLSQIWLHGDHYKWRAMRTCGVPERLITGDASDEEKFHAWAATVPETLKNPLYHWTHLELRSYFGIDGLLNKQTSTEIWEHCNKLLSQPDYSTQNLLRRMDVKVVCTTDDPTDSLEMHRKYQAEGDSGFALFPTFRPDKALQVEKGKEFLDYIKKLESASNLDITTFKDFMDALQARHDYFDELGCRASDHGIEEPYAHPFNQQRLQDIFDKAVQGQRITHEEALTFKSGLMHAFAVMDHEKGWAFQMHIGALRNNNKRKLKELGPDTGFDSIGDFEVAKPLSSFLNQLEENHTLPRTIIYNLNPRDNALISTMIGNFQDGEIAGKVQHGPGWWFQDQKEGMEEQLQTLANMSCLNRFIGMVTDSRSFLSYPRHEYYRRILCNMLGNDVEQGIVPEDYGLLRQLIENVCYKNALEYFRYDRIPEAK